jgi:hypothetical protein
VKLHMIFPEGGWLLLEVYFNVCHERIRPVFLHRWLLDPMHVDLLDLTNSLIGSALSFKNRAPV